MLKLGSFFPLIAVVALSFNCWTMMRTEIGIRDRWHRMQEAKICSAEMMTDGLASSDGRVAGILLMTWGIGAVFGAAGAAIGILCWFPLGMKPRQDERP